MTDKLRLGCVISLLLVSTADLRWISHKRFMPPPADFSAFPMHVAGWSGTVLPDIAPSEKRALAADDYLLRGYRQDTTGSSIVLFVAYYRSQRNGDAIHSPKNCLPGAGWAPVSSRVIRVENPLAAGSSFMANHYVIEKDGVQQDVLYWYQTYGAMFASEYQGKVYLAWNAITKGRTDGALIRITALRGAQHEQTFEGMVAFAGELAPLLSHFLPS